MKYNNLHILLLLFFVNFGYTQTEHSASELNSFVEVYMESKTITSEIDDGSVLLQKLIEYGISQERYKTIFIANIENRKEKLNPNEIVFFDELQKIDIQRKREKEKQIVHLCESKDMDTSRYASILKRYKTDIGFQRSLKHYFDQFIKSKK